MQFVDLNLQTPFSYIVESHPDAIIVTDKDGQWIYINHQGEVLYKKYFSSSKLEALGLTHLFFNTLEALDAFNTFKEKVTQKGQILHTIVRMNETGYGKIETRFFEEANQTFFIHKIREENTGTEVNKLGKELAETKKELNEFAYIISHDLKAPLRAILTLSEWIVEDYGDSFDEEGKQKMALLQGRVKRLHSLIDGVLQYSRIGRFVEESTKIDLKELIAYLINSIPVPEYIDFQHEKENLPVLFADKIRIYELFHFIIKNALESLENRDNAFIRLEVNNVEDFYEFCISDNGRGIKERNLNDVYKIFYTGKNKSENIGMGLTLAQRIVRLYGGRIRIESEIDKGTKVYFSLPAYTESSK